MWELPPFYRTEELSKKVINLKCDLEPVSKLVVLLTRNYLFVKWTNIIQRYRMGFGNK
ncbi:hypothetical protein LEP1GSC081_4222 [Leptospira kirschneri str. H1]|uniref:Uncharacterized protein n=1 Tax=Leptospira kirschneri str. H1 TaxID=1049966 RepID=A0A0E2B362_9LEPT|nr:hypothetical protein LEP1GSC081_4222 [Leptospira kirschneri str. H1]